MTLESIMFDGFTTDKEHSFCHNQEIKTVKLCHETQPSSTLEGYGRGYVKSTSYPFLGVFSCAHSLIHLTASALLVALTDLTEHKHNFQIITN